MSEQTTEAIEQRIKTELTNANYLSTTGKFDEARKEYLSIYERYCNHPPFKIYAGRVATNIANIAFYRTKQHTKFNTDLANEVLEFTNIAKDLGDLEGKKLYADILREGFYTVDKNRKGALEIYRELLLGNINNTDYQDFILDVLKNYISLKIEVQEPFNNDDFNLFTLFINSNTEIVNESFYKYINLLMNKVGFLLANHDAEEVENFRSRIHELLTKNSIQKDYRPTTRFLIGCFASVGLLKDENAEFYFRDLFNEENHILSGIKLASILLEEKRIDEVQELLIKISQKTTYQKLDQLERKEIIKILKKVPKDFFPSIQSLAPAGVETLLQLNLVENGKDKLLEELKKVYEIAKAGDLETAVVQIGNIYREYNYDKRVMDDEIKNQIQDVRVYISTQLEEARKAKEEGNALAKPTEPTGITESKEPVKLMTRVQISTNVSNGGRLSITRKEKLPDNTLNVSQAPRAQNLNTQSGNTSNVPQAPRVQKLDTSENSNPTQLTPINPIGGEGTSLTTSTDLNETSSNNEILDRARTLLNNKYPNLKQKDTTTFPSIVRPKVQDENNIFRGSVRRQPIIYGINVRKSVFRQPETGAQHGSNVLEEINTTARRQPRTGVQFGKNVLRKINTTARRQFNNINAALSSFDDSENKSKVKHNHL